MAFLDATLWNDYQVVDGSNDKRFSQLGLVEAASDSTPFMDWIMPDTLNMMRTISSIRDVQFPVIKDQTVVVNTTPGFNYIPANLPETDTFAPLVFDVFSGFRFYPAAFNSSPLNAEYVRTQTMLNVAYQMGKTIETIIASVLETRKTQVLGFTTQVSQGDGTFSFSTVTDTLTVSKAAQKETMFYNLEVLMGANELGGGYRIVTNRGGLALQKAEQLKYGVNNDKNLQALGMFPMDRMYESESISAGNDVFQGWLFRDGAIGLIENFPYDFANGTEIAGRKWSITDAPLPFCGMRANIYTNSQPTEATALISSSSVADLKMTHFEEMGMWCRFFIPTRYNSSISTRANDIVKIVGATS
jgi:hypothetical protein